MPNPSRDSDGLSLCLRFGPAPTGFIQRVYVGHQRFAAGVVLHESSYSSVLLFAGYGQVKSIFPPLRDHTQCEQGQEEETVGWAFPVFHADSRSLYSNRTVIFFSFFEGRGGLSPKNVCATIFRRLNTRSLLRSRHH